MEDLSCSLSRSCPERERAPSAVPGAARPQSAPIGRQRRDDAGNSHIVRDADEKTFLELRRKVQSSELLSASTEKLLATMKFNGHLTVVVQHGRVVKSGYEEGYFRRNSDLGGVLFEKMV